MDFTAVNTYLENRAYTEPYTELEESVRQKIVFTAEDMLTSHYDESLMTPKMVGLQALYLIEGEAEEFSKFKRHNVKSLGLKGMSFSFDGENEISPEVKKLIVRAQEALHPEEPQAGVGRVV
ncbi:hypothetical protein [Domibacillus enclensis]|uniref:Phage gp6-like head-tail connector protein n=1 Tax=Domibacillus enclensis TaxID=1017273 RepID=A0A1N6WJC2_9BACI|nr:hypothetical protein [Domibacillus enclensis]OXS77953.1 hypothetical protein B1B05_10125 [Domibacillus enclensis]SIQ90171.1 hypothetical protein SAMN05443094_104186 [Domibacillus enclensis]